MSLLHFLFYTPGFPDDAIWEGRDLIQPAGKAAALAIFDGLRKHGFECSNPEIHEYEGWSLDVSLGKARYWCYLQQFKDSGSISCVVNRSVWDLLGMPADDLGPLKTALSEISGAEPRFQETLWIVAASASAADEEYRRRLRK